MQSVNAHEESSYTQEEWSGTDKFLELNLRLPIQESCTMHIFAKFLQDFFRLSVHLMAYAKL